MKEPPQLVSSAEKVAKVQWKTLTTVSVTLLYVMIALIPSKEMIKLGFVPIVKKKMILRRANYLDLKQNKVYDYFSLKSRDYYIRR